MHRLFKYSVVIMVFIYLSVASANPVNALIDKEFSLGIGQSARIDGEKLIIKFKAVLEDSRCPINALCAWAGNGKVEFEVLDIDGESKTIVLNTEDEPRLAPLKRHTLKLVSLKPARIDGVSISPGDYRVTLSVRESHLNKDRIRLSGLLLYCQYPIGELYFKKIFTIKTRSVLSSCPSCLRGESI